MRAELILSIDNVVSQRISCETTLSEGYFKAKMAQGDFSGIMIFFPEFYKEEDLDKLKEFDDKKELFLCLFSRGRRKEIYYFKGTCKFLFGVPFEELANFSRVVGLFSPVKA